MRKTGKTENKYWIKQLDRVGKKEAGEKDQKE